MTGGAPASCRWPGCRPPRRRRPRWCRRRPPTPAAPCRSRRRRCPSVPTVGMGRSCARSRRRVIGASVAQGATLSDWHGLALHEPPAQTRHLLAGPLGGRRTAAGDGRRAHLLPGPVAGATSVSPAPPPQADASSARAAMAVRARRVACSPTFVILHRTLGAQPDCAGGGRMGLIDKLKGELVDIIEWIDDSHSTLAWRFPRYNNEIKNGAQLIVREGQRAVFVYRGSWRTASTPAPTSSPPRTCHPQHAAGVEARLQQPLPQRGVLINTRRSPTSGGVPRSRSRCATRT